jgi:hypothetical protein
MVLKLVDDAGKRNVEANPAKALAAEVWPELLSLNTIRSARESDSR